MKSDTHLTERERYHIHMMNKLALYANRNSQNDGLKTSQQSVVRLNVTQGGGNGYRHKQVRNVDEAVNPGMKIKHSLRPLHNCRKCGFSRARPL